MKEVVERALNVAALRGAQFADVRAVVKRTRSVAVKNGQVEAVAMHNTTGFGVRALIDGSWGFASAATLTTDKAAAVAALACTIARASARVQAAPVRLAAAPVSGTATAHRSSKTRSPSHSTTPSRCCSLRRGPWRRNRRSRWRRPAPRPGKSTNSTATAKARSSSRRLSKVVPVSRRQPSPRTRCRNAPIRTVLAARSGRRAGSWSRGMDLVGNAPRIAAEAGQLLHAEPCPSGSKTIILDPTQVALQVHESCGHPTELDRVFGTEASFAGTSFLTLRSAERIATDRSWSTSRPMLRRPAGWARSATTTRGVAAQRTPLVVEGRFVGYLTSRDTAALLGEASNGTARADAGTAFR